MKVTLIFRKPYNSSYSIEFIFNSIFNELEEGGKVAKFILPEHGKGPFQLFKNIFSVLRFKKQIIHITGDCHYVILGAIFNKRILTIHDLSFLNRTSGIRKIVLKFLWLTIPVRLAHSITVVSETTKSVVLKEGKVEKDKVTVIPNFIDPIYRPVDRVFQNSCPRVLQIGTTFNKNIERLAKALEGLSCSLVIIGKLSKEQREILESLNINYQNKFGLSKEELFAEYCQADMLVFASTVEGFGLPILEAQASGLPVITSNCSSMPEVAGQGALLVDPHNVDSIKNGIQHLINNKELRNSLVQKGFENVQKYSMDNVTKAYKSLYQKIMVS